MSPLVTHGSFLSGGGSNATEQTFTCAPRNTPSALDAGSAPALLSHEMSPKCAGWSFWSRITARGCQLRFHW